MMDLFEAARATAGTAYGGPEMFGGVSTDSRTIGAGELFVALVGERFDGHDYLAAVRERGAAAALVANDHLAQVKDCGLPLIAVSDTRLALGRLAACWRQKFSLPLVAVTGSNGKTTTKEMMASIFAAQAVLDGYDPEMVVLATRGNLNNDIGLPLTLLKLNRNHRAAIIEAGMNHPGEIAYLADIARPTVALVTNALRAHLEGMGSLDAVAAEKGSLFEHVAAGGIAVMNADAEHVGLWRRQIGERRCAAFSLHGQATRYASEAALAVNGEVTLESGGSQLNIHTSGGSCSVFLQMPGRHNAANALAAAAATLAAGVSLAAVQAGLSAFRGVKGRLQQKAGANGSTLYDDTYNANPDSMRAALDVLSGCSGRRVFVVGDMGETGAEGLAYHREIGAYARQCGIDALYALGEMSREAVAAFGAGAEHFAEPAMLAAVLKPALDSNTTVLVKGSRFMKMERVVDLLEANPATNAAAPGAGKETTSCS